MIPPECRSNSNGQWASPGPKIFSCLGTRIQRHISGILQRHENFRAAPSSLPATMAPRKPPRSGRATPLSGRAEFNNSGLARQGAQAALDLASTRDVEILAAMTFARIGDAARALALADKLNKEFPVNTIQQSYWQPTIRAEIELSRNNSDKAIALLQTAAPYELGGGTPIGGLYPVFVRGQAFLRERQGARAAAEVQKLIDHRGIVQNLPLGALAHLYLGRAYVVGGDMARARAAYQDFLSLWKDADADIPILKEAKAEYAKLQ